MSETDLHSTALQQTLLKSEGLRILVILAFVVFFEVVYAVRIFLLGSLVPRWGLLAFPGFGIYELVILFAVRRALVEQRDLPAALWRFNIVLEMCMPALALAFLIGARLPNAWAPLASIGYFGAAYYRGWRISLEGASRSSVTQSAVVVYGIIILASGFVAGVVASEIRKYMQAALREAQTQQQLQQVQHDLDIARSIQQSLLPRVRPCLAGFEIDGWNHSADATGGDYFDWKLLADGRLVVTMADVTGHGIGPALLASICRAYSRASFNFEDSLPATLQRINRAFGEDLTSGGFATFVAVICQAGNDKVQVFSAGHGPLLAYFSRTNRFEEIMPQSIPLGLMPDLEADSPKILDLQPGDLLLLITDGFVEWPNVAGEEFGTERLSETIRRVSHLPRRRSLLRSTTQSLLLRTEASNEMI